MEKLTTNEIRQKYLDFFKEKEHYVMESFPLVPKDDKSLLLINAGMAPLKPYFTGVKVPPSKRVTSCQKCIRTGDIDNVGRTKRHATFFEMLGNFSFGDYFKEEIIPWAWEFVTEVLKIDKSKLYATVYFEDDEAFEIWKNKTDINPDRIFRLGKEDNFWEIGVGPCGPCSEIHYYKGTDEIKTTDDFIAASDRDEMTEFWNLVFTQFDKDEEGNYNLLANPNIDTGMGLERMATIMQGVDSIFEIDVLKNIIDKVTEVTGKAYGKNKAEDVSIRIIADHAKSIAFLIGDGVLPSNEGRGYVLRRLLRRAARHGRVLGHKKLFLNQIISAVMESYGKAYPDLLERREYIEKIVDLEEKKFHETLDAGMEMLLGFVEETEGDTFSGEHAFKLYDTYGFPLELTEEIIAEKGMKIDLEAFRKEMNDQRQRARAARGESSYMGSENSGIDVLEEAVSTTFTGYSSLSDDAEIVFIYNEDELVEHLEAGQKGYVVSDRTPFYAEMGGQVGDVGFIAGEAFKAEVHDTRKSRNGNTVHLVAVLEGNLTKGKANFQVAEAVRKSTERNHTATHLLHKALKMVLGSHVNQAGSVVQPDKLRFDFNHFQPMTEEEIRSVEQIVNEEILKATPVSTALMSMSDAKASGAMALFDEKYGDEVRVLSVGEFSMELCGGTHVKNSGEIGLFKVTSEAGIASGVRRIEAVTGMNSFELFNQKEKTLSELQDLLKVGKNEIVNKVSANLQDMKALQKELEETRKAQSLGYVDELLKMKEEVHGVQLVRGEVQNVEAGDLRDLTEKILDKLQSGIVVLAAKGEGKVNFSVMISKDKVKDGYHAGKLIKEIAAIAGGGGGGRPDMAQAGGKKPEMLQEALEAVEELLKK
ncbi:alanine--tRNA ligase [Proteiniclasticum sp. SCR006]|uniref:Alanine--tRNA ligase n=1 Tax=Proteiniclasticum aestuarii TaxID=2817862 RepID=A0A939H5Q9_9CLOT|nr:alanine--tRNA ligase [Proteiniclasticum aestuarii]MBO1263631.1 alanine--tRNA ligase [Proteiniclasticum aestuarii]